MDATLRFIGGATHLPGVDLTLVSQGTFRLDRASDLEAFLARFPPNPSAPTLYEEFVYGTEYSFDGVVIDGRPVWHSISRYMPSPLEVLENDWIQWCVMPQHGQPPSDSYEGDGYIIVRYPETHIVENALQQIVQLIRVELH